MINISPIKQFISGAKPQVFVGLSGGVDSAVSAALLKKDGYDVTGVFIKIQIPGYPCPAAEDRVEAMRVAAHLRVPFIEIDLSKEYEREVFRPSIREFEKGRTPNPDTLCNEKIKFGLFFDFARSRGADFVATGHYARIIPAHLASQRSSDLLYGVKARRKSRPFAKPDTPSLLGGVDPDKDQSYFLWMVPETVLRHTLFPVGSLKKTEVRKLAENFALPNRARKDSQGLCFLSDISIEDMLKREVAPKAGSVLDEKGNIVGKHSGAALYTLGQRHGFELFAHTPETKPHFVIAKNIEQNTIVVSTSRFPEGKNKTSILLQDANWIGESADGKCEAQYRYHGERIKAALTRNNGQATVVLETPHYVPEGQSLVLYRGDRCLGGGVIESVTLL